MSSPNRSPIKNGEFSLYYHIYGENVCEVRDYKEDFFSEITKLFCKAGWDVILLRMPSPYIDIKIKAKAANNGTDLDLSN
jgi:hypothetical protein